MLGHDKPTAQDLIRLGSFEVFTTFFIGRLLKDYLPKTQVEIHELVPGKLEEALLLNRIDLGITYEPVPRPKIEYVKIGRVNMAAFATKDTFAGHDLAEIPFAVPVNPLEGAPSGVKGLDAWPEQKYRRNAVYRVDLMATGLELTRQGLCAIFIPEFVAKLHNESAPARFHLHALPLPKAMAQVHRDIYLLQRESSIESRTTKKVAQALREVCI